MSLPQFPNNDSSLSREDVINQIISSIAMEELGLSHIINAEGEKLQYALGTIEGVDGPEKPATIEDLLELNQSIRKTLDSTMMNQFFLKEKMQGALSAAVMRGPAGPVGTILDSYDTLDDLIAEHPTGNQGDAYLVNGELYTWNTEQEKWISVGNLMGPTGPQGVAGPVSTILNSYETLDDLLTDHPVGNVGDLYLVGGELYAWIPDEGGWTPVGNLMGPEGPQGLTGAVGTILNTYGTLNDLIAEHPTGNQGDAYLVGDGDLYVWKENATSWEKAGNLRGPQGPAGPQGDIGPMGAQGPAGPAGEQGPAGLSGVIKSIFPTVGELTAAYPNGGEQGDLFLVGDTPGNYHVYFWDGTAWTDAGPFSGTQGPAGPAGAQGANTVILGSLDSLDDLQKITGNIGESYLVQGNLYTWTDDGSGGAWKLVGNLMGPTGTFDPGGKLFTVNGTNGTIDVVYGGNLTFNSSTLGISVNPATSTVDIENPAAQNQGYSVQFNSIEYLRLQSGISGSRSNFCGVGIGGETVYPVTANDPRVNFIRPGFPIKMLTGGTIAEVRASLVADKIQTDASISLFAQLYYTPGFDSREFQPVPGSLIDLGSLQTGSPVGALRTAKTADTFSFQFSAGTQFILGFFNTSAGATAGNDVFLSGAMKIV